MDKLIELLNEYEVEKKPSRLQRNYYLWFVHNFWKWIMYIDEEWEDVDDYRTDYEIISKEYGFIKWLVENKKIDRSTIHIYAEPYYDLRDYTTDDFKKINWVNELLMLLAIQNNPIEFLISILK
jgi:hypothetical protein